MKSPTDIFYDGLLSEDKLAEEAPVTRTPSVTTPPAPKQINQKSLFSHPEAHPMVLDLALLKFLGIEWFSWLSDTLFFEIEKTFSTSIADVNRLKILAAQTLHVTDAFWNQWEIFEKTITALNGIVPLPELMQPPDLSILYAGVDIANQIRKEDFGGDVARYCAAVFLNEDVQWAPTPLEFCQQYITQPMYECKDCGKRGSALPPFEGLCTSCAGYFTTDTPFSMKPDPEALKRGAGRNITLTKLYDPAPIEERFAALQKLPADKLNQAVQETSNDISAARLIIATDFKNYRDKQLHEQLGELRGWLESA